MRSSLTGLVACAAFATMVPHGARAALDPRLDDTELAGLPRGSRPVPMTWERAYALALVGSRAQPPARGGSLAGSLDPDDLADRARRHGVADFARFRADFLASDAGTGTAEGKFRDPSGDMFELLRRLQAVENARRNAAIHEQFLHVIRELVEGGSSGLSQFDLDRLDLAIQKARRGLIDEVLHYREKLDEFKVKLGLSPGAPVTPDRGSLAAFHDVFAAIEEWSRDPRRDMTDLPRIVGKLPAPVDLVIDGRPIFAVIDGNPDQLEDVLAAGARVALKDRSDPAKAKVQALDHTAAPLELRVRRRLRRLLETRLAYLLQMRSLVLAIRSMDQAFERLIAPPAGGPFVPRSPILKDLIDQQAQILHDQNELVALWTSFQGERLAFYRDLGTLPCDDWKSFYEQLSAKPGDGGQGPIAPAAGPPARLGAPPLPP